MTARDPLVRRHLRVRVPPSDRADADGHRETYDHLILEFTPEAAADLIAQLSGQLSANVHLAVLRETPVRGMQSLREKLRIGLDAIVTDETEYQRSQMQ